LVYYKVAMIIKNRRELATTKDKELDIEAYIERCDSHTLLEKIGNSLLTTGDTGTNVGDVIVYLMAEKGF